jgi:hypothetical protein
MPWVGFELTIPVFERAKILHALYRAASVIGKCISDLDKFLLNADANKNFNIVSYPPKMYLSVSYFAKVNLRKKNSV